MTTAQDLCKGPDSVLVPGVLRGYRTWRLTSLGQLQSTNMDFVWSANVRAICPVLPSQLSWFWSPCDEPTCSTCHPPAPPPPCASSPGAGCTCGIYSWYRPDDTRIVPADVFGCVEVRGRVNLGTHGFRAETARVLGLVAPSNGVPGGWWDLIEAGVQVFPDRNALLEELPPDDVSGLVDHTCGAQCDPPRPPAAVWTFPAAHRVGWSWHITPTHSTSASTPQIPTSKPAPPGPVLGPKTVAQAALEARRTRNTGPERKQQQRGRR